MTLSLNKSIQAQRLHPRTGAPTTDPESTIPFGAILEYSGRDRDFEKFKYMGENYRSKHDEFASATNYSLVETASTAENDAAMKPVPTAASAAPPAPAGPKLTFEAIPSNIAGLRRAKVPGGWLLAIGAASITFYPDPDHTWNGISE